jgi:hypothetical protein
VYKGRRIPRLRKWIELETYKEKIIEAAEEKQIEFPKYLLSYLSAAFGVPYKWFEYSNWEKIIYAFYVCVDKCPQIKLPITIPTGEKLKEDDWSYDGRTWHLYSHIIAKAYGWDLEYISRLSVEDGLAIIQEIMVDEQLEKEFYYGLSEVAYSYDKNTQTSKFVPLPRPNWMRPKVEPEKIKKFSIPANMLPMGVTILPGTLPEDFLPKEYETKKT